MISDFFHPDVGGVENHIYMLGASLIRRGHKVIVITHSHSPDRVGIRWLVPGLKVYHIPFPTLVSSATLPNFLTFLPYLRTIVLRERITLIHSHASLSSLGHEGILHAHLLGVRTVFTDHSLFGFADAASILTNKLLEGMLRNVDAAICVSHIGRENTVLRANLPPKSVYVIPNAIVADHFRPVPSALPTDTITVVVISRLAYRKGVDLLVATAPRICAAFPNVRFVVGGHGPKMVDLLQMREIHFLQDRITLLGPIAHRDVPSVLRQGSIFLNTSLTEAFGIAILEAACAGLHVVSTRVGGVPEILPEDMISFAAPTADDVFRAMSEAIAHISRGEHDPHRAHEKIRAFYDWARVAERTEAVYREVLTTLPYPLWIRIQRTMGLGPFVGPIYTMILIVDCLFFAFLEWWMPRENIDYVNVTWDATRFAKIAGYDHT
ncbi:transferase [Multifurca ochricompacta]|uniref:Transferase n=1 Tax=Multifurca ochricompacta TaxID=376703 RepID=A0AAD4QP93_9AGAM|nr:transferase [Multifurca ochricompacta]